MIAIAPFAMRRFLMAAVLGGAVMVPYGVAYADPLGLAQSGGGGLEVESDNGIEWRRNEQVLIARGNAVAKRGNSRVDADELRALYRDRDGQSEIYRIIATGNVKLSSETDVATGDQAIYDIDDAVVVLTGEDLQYKTPTETLTAEESLEYWEAERMAVARGNAVAVADDRTLRGDVLTARFEMGKNGENDLSRIDGNGNVTIRTPTDFVVGNQGVYDAKTGIATLVGSVKITRGENQLNGDRAVVDLNTGVSRLTANGNGDGKSRVRGLLVPEKDEENSPGQSGNGN
ncbi:LptA/OstA family protein [Thalassospira xiamenensis]|uniref:Lipopolysaccharide export system protein LptA n=1 Tax=Thalassospira xiamenensis TaxID=220697 RepID=A0A285T7Z4_9PROT|nr:LptA/OstA family protein [Thalassospira xiamenensis]SOC17023.1 lipopolysaccharide export system protein LptA [Thalassospira xiamenensis]